jgi:hypothetical protein
MLRGFLDSVLIEEPLLRLHLRTHEELRDSISIDRSNFDTVLFHHRRAGKRVSFVCQRIASPKLARV